jgi:autophagy-related protein 9
VDDAPPPSIVVESDGTAPISELDYGGADAAVPQSLMVETPQEAGGELPKPSAEQTGKAANNFVRDDTWNNGGIRQRQGQGPILPLYEEPEPSQRIGRNDNSYGGQLKSLDPAERARWKWANVDNLDIFLQEVYAYFLGNGMWCILLTKAVNMATLLFVVGFSTYLTSCIDYSKLSSSSKLSDVQVDRCVAKMGFFHKFVVWLVLLFWLLKAFQYVGEIRGLIEMRNFYKHLLNIDEDEMQTISWQQVVSRIMLLRDQNFAVAHRHARNKLDAHEIANRIMRKENYLIAMISKDVLDLSVPLPFLRNRGPTFTKTLEWNIGLCVMDYAFNDSGQLRPIFLKEDRRKLLSDGLRRRFMFAGTMNVICAPFTVVYLTLLYFFRYFNEYHRDPSAIGTRQYTPLAEWKMRELNELYHFFERRLRMSQPAASRYVNQFPKEKAAVVLRFVAFVAGSFAAVLGIISLVDPELFLGFEITKDRTVLFYIGVFGSILAISRSMIVS